MSNPFLAAVQPAVATSQHFSQHELAMRWRMSVRTLERWRCQRHGPAFLKLGGRVVYRLEDVADFEAAQRQRTATA